MNIYPKHDYILDRDLRPCERLEPQRNTINHIRRLLDSLESTLNNASDQLSEHKLNVIADAVQMAYNAAENAAFLGISGFSPRPVCPVSWEKGRMEPPASIVIEVREGMVQAVYADAPTSVEVCDLDISGTSEEEQAELESLEKIIHDCRNSPDWYAAW